MAMKAQKIRTHLLLCSVCAVFAEAKWDYTNIRSNIDLIFSRNLASKEAAAPTISENGIKNVGKDYWKQMSSIFGGSSGAQPTEKEAAEWGFTSPLLLKHLPFAKKQAPNSDEGSDSDNQRPQWPTRKQKDVPAEPIPEMDATNREKSAESGAESAKKSSIADVAAGGALTRGEDGVIGVNSQPLEINDIPDVRRHWIPPRDLLQNLNCSPTKSFGACADHCMTLISGSDDVGGTDLNEDLLHRKISKVLTTNEYEKLKICLLSVCARDYLRRALPGCINSKGELIPLDVPGHQVDPQQRPGGFWGTTKHDLAAMKKDYAELNLYNPEKVIFYNQYGYFGIRAVLRNMFPSYSFLAYPLFLVVVALLPGLLVAIIAPEKLQRRNGANCWNQSVVTERLCTQPMPRMNTFVQQTLNAFEKTACALSLLSLRGQRKQYQLAPSQLEMQSF